MLSADLDALEEVLAGYNGPLKIQVCGPWTLAATIERSRSQEPVLGDPGAVRDLIESLAEGVAAHIAEIGKRVPAARVLLQLDEPALPAVVAGRVPTASGLSRLAAVEAGTAAGGLRTVLSATQGVAIVHCCAIPLPFGIIKEAGAAAVSLDLSLLGRADEDALAEVADAGLGILAGAVPPEDTERASQPGMTAARDTATGVIEIWRRMGFPAQRCTEQVVITPACGLAGTSPAYARAALARCREAARLLPELIEEGMS
jgi:methionine synthase II (cobalamin-independent)